MIGPIPVGFRARMNVELGEREAEALCRAMDDRAAVAVRLHPDKGMPWPGTEPVPWCAEGRYLLQRPSFTLDPLFHAGAYYVQEAASQFVGRVVGAAVARSGPGLRLLDLCAAPGGKSTLYASMLGPLGLLVANEPVRQRAAVLADNIHKWGTGNAVVTSCDGRRLEALGAWFDVVAVDAPCSGEGMFRKEEEARRAWSEATVERCARRQSEILRSAYRLLRPGGTLLYSTCTFNRTENEEVLLRLAAEAAFEPEDVDPVHPAWGISEGEAGPFRTFRFLPHRTRSEGFFVAAARKASGEKRAERAPSAAGAAVLAPADRRTAAELSRWIGPEKGMCFCSLRGRYHAVPAAFRADVEALVRHIPVLTAGVEMGTLYDGRLKPDHALALYTGLDRTAAPAAELPPDEALRYLRCEAVAADRFADGINRVCFDGRSLGWAKRVEGRVNNLYPRSLRILQK